MGRRSNFRSVLLALVGVAAAGACLPAAQASVSAAGSGNDIAGVREVWTSVDAIAPDDVWAVGVRSDYYPLLKHWDGKDWRVSTPPGGIRNLSGVDHTSSSDVWVGGQGGVIHWDGSAWTMSYDADDLTVVDAVVALAPDDVWATGFAMNRVGGFTVHWDGTRWTRVGKSHPANWNFAIGADSANDVWVVGEDTISTWNGRHWQRLPGAPTGVYDLAVQSPTDVWLVGHVNGRRPPDWAAAVWHWDGHQFTQTDLPPSGADSLFNAIDVVSTTDAWAVGKTTGAKGHTRPLIEHWNGDTWEVVPPPALNHTSILQDVSGLTEDAAWAVGSAREHKFYPSTLTLGWDGSVWTRLD